jgi:integrase
MPKKKEKARSKRGAVKVEGRNGILYLRCSVEGVRHTFSLNTPDSPANRHEANKIANLIEGDKLRGEFDPTYHRYRGQKEQAIVATGQTLATLWPQWVEHRQTTENLTPQTVNTRYKSNGNHLTDYGRDIRTEAEARSFLASLRLPLGKQGGITNNRCLDSYQAFTKWALNKGLIEVDPFVKITPIKASQPLPRQPFSTDEVARILAAFKTHPDFYHYHDYVAACVTLGLRISEVIGLQWKRCNFEARTIDVSDCLGRGDAGGSAAHQRERREPKGSKMRRRIPSPLLTILQGRYNPDCKPDDLIFAVDNKAIDDQIFRKGPWTKILKIAGVPYRCPNTLRHTMASHAIAQNIPETDIAKMMGHTSLRMVRGVYCHSLVDMPEAPDMGL